MRRLELLNLALLAALLALAVWAWPQLPERIPTHFNARGEADAWSGRSSWFLLPAIATFTTVLMLVVARVTARHPRYVNLPSKARLLALPAEEQQPILRVVQSLVIGVNTVVLLMLGAIQWATYQTALGRPAEDLLGAVLVMALVVLPALTLWTIVRSTQLIDAAYRRAQMQGTLRQP